MAKGKLYVVGIGPGGMDDMTIRAQKVLEKCSHIAGYTVYCNLVRPFYPEKEYIETPMMGEEKRVRMALDTAAKGSDVALICSGDAGVYGLAGLAISMAKDHDDISVQVIPGVTAALSGAALLGAPLIHDFCVISLSDRLTPMEVIEERLKAAAKTDMVIVLYNPESRSRAGYLEHACKIILAERGLKTICGIARNIGRDNEGYEIMNLNGLKEYKADMFTTVFIGNSSTQNLGGMMVTQRGYLSEK